MWLRASVGFLVGRVDPTHRPLLAAADDPSVALGALLAEREPLYAAVADHVVDVEPFHTTDDKPKRALARHIAALVAGDGPAAGGDAVETIEAVDAGVIV